MTRTLTLCYFSFLVATSLQAQITIGSAEMPHAGDQITRTSAVVNPFIDFGATGAGSVWDFSDLHAMDQNLDAYQSVASTNIVYAVVYADIFFNPDRANHAKAGIEIPFSDLLPVDDPYTFNYRSSSEYKTVGFGAEVSGIPLPIIFDQHDVIYELPLQYGNTHSSSSAWTVDVPELAYYGYSQVRSNEVDGWGTVTTPAGTYDALRVRTTIEGRDSVQVDILEAGFAIERPEVNQYKWLSNGVRQPVLQINTITLFGTEVVTEIFFHDAPRELTVVEPLPTVLCPGAIIEVPYEAVGAYNVGNWLLPANIFRAQLSDANGDFTDAVTIGQVTATTSGTITATIPAGIAPGNGYRIRATASSPVLIGSDNGFDLGIGEGPLAQAMAMGATTFCEGASVMLEAIETDGQTYQWLLDGEAVDGADASTLEATMAGEYAVVVNNTCGEAVSDPVAVIVNVLPAHVPAQTVVALCNDQAALLEAIDQSGQDDLEYQWSFAGEPINGAESSMLETSLPGTYTLEVSNSQTGCSFSMSPVEVTTETVATPSLMAMGGTAFCEGGAVLLEADGDGTGGYQWTLDGMPIPDADTDTWQATENGLYAVVAVSENGCVSDASTAVEVIVHALPTVPEVGSMGNTAFCEGGMVVLTADSDGAAFFQWFQNGLPIPGEDQSELMTETTGAYSALAVSAEGCVSAASEVTEVTVEPIPAAPAVEALGATSFCAGGTVLLQGNDEGDGSYQWMLDDQDIPGAIGLELEASASGTYALVYTSSADCSSDPSEGILVTVLEGPAGPEIFPEGPLSVCAGGSLELAVDAIAGLSYQWHLAGVPIPGEEAYFMLADQAGSYTVAVVDADGCDALSEVPVVVSVLDLPEAAEIVQVVDTLFAMGEGAFQWLLNGEPIPGATGDYLVVTENGDYTVVVTDGNGCSNTSEVYVFDTVGMHEVAGVDLSVYPNPNNGAFVVQLDALPKGDTFYTIHDATGKLVQQGGLRDQLTDIDLGGTAAGMYMLQVVQGRSLTTMRVMVGR